jgi:hypothetical protein
MMRWTNKISFIRWSKCLWELRWELRDKNWHQLNTLMRDEMGYR